MSKRKYSVINYIESEESSFNKGLTDGENIAKTFKKEPTFNFKSYLDGICNGYAIGYKSLNNSDESKSDVSDNISIETSPLLNKVTLETYINHAKASYNKGNKDGELIVKNTEIQFINFKCYLDGICDGYTNYESKITKPPNFFNFNSSDCIFRFPSSPHLTTLRLLNDD